MYNKTPQGFQSQRNRNYKVEMSVLLILKRPFTKITQCKRFPSEISLFYLADTGTMTKGHRIKKRSPEGLTK